MDPQINDIELLENLHGSRDRFLNEIGKTIIGQTDVLHHILIALFCKGHTLIVGVPGLAKTLMIKTMAELLELNFSRIQFTPDLMPSDITGTEIIEEDHSTGKRGFRFFKGPVFGNIILADEISPDTCRLWDVKSDKKLDKDRFRKDLGNVIDAYQEVANRLGI